MNKFVIKRDTPDIKEVTDKLNIQGFAEHNVEQIIFRIHCCKNCFKAKDNEEFYKKMVSIVNEKVTNIDEIIQNAYDIALERDLVKIGEKYKKYYEEFMGFINKQNEKEKIPPLG